LGVRKDNIPAVCVYQQAGFQPYSWVGDEAGTGDEDFEAMIIQREDWMNRDDT
jgi:hypothetical protein